jgi:hypothetical protein
MKATVGDKIVSKISGGRINTVHMKRDEMVDLVDKCFIQQATTQEEYRAIWKTIKRGIIIDKYLVSKDEKYELHTKSSQFGGSLHKYVWIHDKSENVFYEYDYWYGFYGKFKKAVKNRLLQAGFVK